MKHIHFIIFLIFLLPFASNAQRIHAFVSAGMAASQIEGDELKGFRHYAFSGGVGALTSLSSNNRWGASVEALFMQRGAYNNSGDPYSIRLDLNYIDIPVLVHFQDPYGGMLIGAGFAYSRLVQQPHNVMKFNPAYFVPDTSDFNFLPNDLSVVADARFTVWRGLQINIRWQHSLLPVKNEWTFIEYKNNGLTTVKHTNYCYNHTILFRLIYQF